MERMRWWLFWASVVVMAVGVTDRLLTAQPLIDGIASGTYWKGAIALLAYSIALSLPRAGKRG